MGASRVLEGVLGDDCRDLAAEAAGERVLVDDEHLPGRPGGFEDGLLVERVEREQVDNRALDPLARELFGGSEGLVQHQAVGEHGEVVAAPRDARVADAVLRRRAVDFLADEAVGALVLEEEHGVGVRDGGLQERAIVGGGRRAPRP